MNLSILESKTFNEVFALEKIFTFPTEPGQNPKLIENKNTTQKDNKKHLKVADREVHHNTNFRNLNFVPFFFTK